MFITPHGTYGGFHDLHPYFSRERKGDPYAAYTHLTLATPAHHNHDVAYDGVNDNIVHITDLEARLRLLTIGHYTVSKGLAFSLVK